MTFASLVEGWARERRPTEKTRYGFGVRAGLLARHLGHEDAARVTADDLRRWRQALVEGDRAASTADSYLTNLRALFRWVPWLLAFTDARVEEVAQALVTDVRERDGTWYLDVNDEGAGKSLKNAGSARRMPLHPALLTEGFLAYVAGLPRDGRLFPDLRPGAFGDLDAAYSKRAGRWLRGLGIADRRKVANHSWRHRFKDVCRDAVVPRDVHDALTGHAGGGVGDRYGSGHSLRTLAEAVRKLPPPPGLAMAGYPRQGQPPSPLGDAAAEVSPTPAPKRSGSRQSSRDGGDRR